MVVRLQFETFKELSYFSQMNMAEEKPYCWNGVAYIRKYRVTVELVEEPVEVLRERVQKLWDECDNFHNWDTIQKHANELGMGRLVKSNVSVQTEARFGADRLQRLVGSMI